MGILGWHLKKKLLSYLKQPRIFQNARSTPNLKILKFWTKIAFIRNFWPIFCLKKLLLYLQSRLLNLSICKVLSKNKNPGILNQKCLIWVFWAGIWKYYCHNSNYRLRVCLISKFGAKIKILNLGLKTPYFAIFGLEFENNIIIFDINALDFAYL